MKTFVAILSFVIPAALIGGCTLQQSTAPDKPTAEQVWTAKLAAYLGQVEQVVTEIDKAKQEGVTDLSEIYGQGAGTVRGDGTFIGDGTGTATLTGVGVVTGEIDGTVMIKGTRDIDVAGFQYLGLNNGYELYMGDGYFTATSDVAQNIEVIVAGDCWVVGAGTGMVFFSGEGYAFWYH